MVYISDRERKIKSHEHKSHPQKSVHPTGAMSSSLSLSNKIEPLIHIHNAIYLLSVEIFCLKYLKNFRIEFLQIKKCFLKHMYNKKENVILINRELWMPAQLDLHFRFSHLQPQSISFLIIRMFFVLQTL